MDPVVLAILGAGALSSAGSVFNNSRQIQFQNEANDTQVNLSNTAHQREVRDLIAAGLNPVLSASGSGASVPQLGTPSLENPVSALSDGISSAVRMNKLEIPQLRSQLALNNSTSARNMADVSESAQRTEQMRLENEFNSATMEDRISLEKWRAAHPDSVSESEHSGFAGASRGSSSRKPLENEFSPEVKKKRSLPKSNKPWWQKSLNDWFN